MGITPDILLRGSLAHLQQARLFQRDAVRLYQVDSLSSAVVLGTISLEHTATSRWLFETAHDSKRVSELTVPSFYKLLQVNHAKRIKRGLHSNPVISYKKPIIQLIGELSTFKPDSDEFRDLRLKIARLLRREQDEYPGQAHGLREKVQYPIFDAQETSWSSEIPTRKRTQFALETAARNYSGVVHSVGRDHAAMTLVGQLGITEIFDESLNWPTDEAQPAK